MARCSRGAKGHVQEFSWGFGVFKPLSKHTQGERLDAGNRW